MKKCICQTCKLYHKHCEASNTCTATVCSECSSRTSCADYKNEFDNSFFNGLKFIPLKIGIIDGLFIVACWLSSYEW